MRERERERQTESEKGGGVTSTITAGMFGWLVGIVFFLVLPIYFAHAKQFK